MYDAAGGARRHMNHVNVLISFHSVIKKQRVVIHHRSHGDPSATTNIPEYLQDSLSVASQALGIKGFGLGGRGHAASSGEGSNCRQTNFTRSGAGQSVGL